MNKNFNTIFFTTVLFTIGIFYYWLFRDSTIVSAYLGVSLYQKELSSLNIDWFPSFIHQFSFVIFTWLALERNHVLFSLFFWFFLNAFFELGQALSSEYYGCFPNIVIDYFKQGTYSHKDMLALMVASFLAYIVMNKNKRILN